MADRRAARHLSLYFLLRSHRWQPTVLECKDGAEQAGVVYLSRG